MTPLKDRQRNSTPLSKKTKKKKNFSRSNNGGQRVGTKRVSIYTSSEEEDTNFPHEYYSGATISHYSSMMSNRSSPYMEGVEPLGENFIIHFLSN